MMKTEFILSDWRIFWWGMRYERQGEEIRFIQASHPSSKIKTAPNFPLCYFLFVVKGAVFFRRFIFGRHVIQPGRAAVFLREQIQ